MNEIDNTEIKQIELEINFYKEQTARNIIEIGKRLIKAKELVPYGEWGKWLDEKIEFTQQTANKYMRVAKEMEDYASISNLGIAKLFNLLSLPAEERETFIEENPVEDMTTRELRQAIKEKKELEKKIEELEKQEPIVIEKEVEVIPNDYEFLKSQKNNFENQIRTLRRNIEDKDFELKKATSQKEILERKAKLNDEEAKKYNDMKKQIDFLYKEKADLGRQIASATELSALAVRIDNMLKTELSPIRYSRVFERMDSEVARENLLEIINKVDQWSFDIKQMIPEKYKRVEVIQHE